MSIYTTTSPATERATRYRYLATNDESDSCSCCGRTRLKRVAWLMELDEEGGDVGEAAPYGTTCAAHLLMGRHPAERKPKIRDAEKAIESALRQTRREICDIVIQMIAPAPESKINLYGVEVLVCGDAEHAIGGLWPEQAAKAVAVDWLANRAAEIAASWGLQRKDSYPGVFVAMLANRDAIQITEAAQR